MDNIYNIPKENAIKNIIIFLFLFFIITFIFSKLYMFLFCSICFMIGYLIWSCQRDIEVEVFDTYINIKKMKSVVLPQEVKTVYFNDIVKISKGSTVYRLFHIIILSDKKKIYIPAEVNKDFDNFIEHLNLK